MWWLIWLGVIVVALIVEGATLSLVSIWFVPGSIAALILSLFDLPVSLQLAVFVVLSLGTLTFLRPTFKKLLKVNPTPTNSDALIGQSGIVTEKIDNLSAHGTVKIKGEVWSARSADGEPIDEGTVVTVSSIEGVKLICKK